MLPADRQAFDYRRLNKKPYWKHGLLAFRDVLEGPRRQRGTSISRIWRAVIAEFFGTLLFVFFATGAVTLALASQSEVTAATLIVVGIGQGFALVIAVSSIANCSGGHCNPAVTIAIFLVGRIHLITALFYIGAQVGGAIIASLLLQAVVPKRWEGNLGSTTLGPGVSQGEGFLLECILTFALTWVIFAVAIDPNGFGKVGPLAIGFTVTIDLLVGFLLTGGSMNPARSLGPAIVSNTWSTFWLYVIGPIVGALVAAIIYDVIIMTRPPHKPKEGRTRMEDEGSRKTTI